MTISLTLLRYFPEQKHITRPQIAKQSSCSTRDRRIVAQLASGSDVPAIYWNDALVFYNKAENSVATVDVRAGCVAIRVEGEILCAIYDAMRHAFVCGDDSYIICAEGGKRATIGGMELRVKV